jgi:hypothetical protein
MTSRNATAAPWRALLRSAASMKAMISRVSSGGTGGTPLRKNASAAPSNAGYAESEGSLVASGRGAPNERIALRP